MSTERAPIGRLLLCATPIGNLEDVTLRVLAELARADIVACEDTRHTRRLLDRHGISARLVSLHEHNEAARARELAARIAAGAVVALVSDAGAPLISDPGFALVRECLQAGLDVEVLPGPSAPLTALQASGLPPDRFTFVGFLPRARGEQRELFAHARETTIAFESPRRLAAALATLAEVDPQRRAAVARELTKLHEEVRRGPARELAEHYRQHPARGEVVLVFGEASQAHADREEALAALRGLIDAGARPRPAAAAVARLTGLAANDLYRSLTSAPSTDSLGAE